MPICPKCPLAPKLIGLKVPISSNNHLFQFPQAHLSQTRTHLPKCSFAPIVQCPFALVLIFPGGYFLPMPTCPNAHRSQNAHLLHSAHLPHKCPFALVLIIPGGHFPLMLTCSNVHRSQSAHLPWCSLILVAISPTQNYLFFYQSTILTCLFCLANTRLMSENRQTHVLKLITTKNDFSVKINDAKTSQCCQHKLTQFRNTDATPKCPAFAPNAHLPQYPSVPNAHLPQSAHLPQLSICPGAHFSWCPFSPSAHLPQSSLVLKCPFASKVPISPNIHLSQFPHAHLSQTPICPNKCSFTLIAQSPFALVLVFPGAHFP